MPSETAWIFPGQGSQAVGMGRDLYASEPAARALWDEADALLGFGLSRLAFEGPELELRRTEHAQPALLVAGLVQLAVLQDRGALSPPRCLAGHSLGEYTALAAAGSLTFSDALRLVRARGELMAAEGERVGGAMSAVFGLAPEQLASLCAEEGADIANLNSPEQTVISGGAEAVARAGERAKAAGARRVTPLPVSGAFHSRLMRPAAGAFGARMAEVPVAPPTAPVIGNVHAAPLSSPEEIRRELEEQLYSPVNWVGSMRRMWELGAREYIEIGPGKVLTGLARRVLPGATASSAESLLAPTRS
jgi:[acyl-carrier-protein] S-malonyltransferase